MTSKTVNMQEEQVEFEVLSTRVHPGTRLTQPVKIY